MHVTSEKPPLSVQKIMLCSAGSFQSPVYQNYMGHTKFTFDKASLFSSNESKYPKIENISEVTIQTIAILSNWTPAFLSKHCGQIIASASGRYDRMCNSLVNTFKVHDLQCSCIIFLNTMTLFLMVQM